MAIKICSLGSGSKGNCVLVTDGRTNLLIDAGLHPVTTVKKLRELGLELTDVDGLLLTHEHDDHIRSVGAFADFMPIFSHPDTLEQVVKKYPVPLKHLMETEEAEFSIGTLDVKPFRVSHDAVHPYGYSVKDWETKFTYLTDTGYVSKGMMAEVKGSNVVMLESNHDKELLLRGRYPEYLKRRILSEKGHLNNEETALTAFDLIVNGTEKIILAHVSENNNLPELAYWTTENFLRRSGLEKGAYKLTVATQRDTLVL